MTREVWRLVMQENLAADAMYPAERVEIAELDDEDDGAGGEITMQVRIRPGHFRSISFRMSQSSFRFFVDSIAGRYHSGGPK